MGLISGLLLLPITAPVRGFEFLLEQMRDQADSVLRDEGRAFAELIDLGMRHAAGQLDDTEFAEQESELLARLDAIREEREQLLEDESYDDDAWDDDEPSDADDASADDDSPPIDGEPVDAGDSVEDER